MVAEDQEWVEFGRNGKAEFWFGTDEIAQTSMHIAFLAEDRGQVDKFHTVALKCGARDNGKPGLRHIYHANYYSAFVIDPDGHNIEAVCHSPSS